jgi:DNA adenine methylase
MPSGLPPVIKWSGSKRSVAPFLAAFIPMQGRYFEPFVGGGAMLPFRKSRTGFASDIIPELIALWISIRDDPRRVADGYRDMWLRRQRDGHRVYYAIRDRFNQHRDPVDFLFLSRTCVNGLIRFNKSGEFNNSLHHTRPGISPETLKGILMNWSAAVHGMTFEAADYRDIFSRVREGDFVFLDPPYEATRGRYQHTAFDANEFYSQLEQLNSIGANWMLTYDGEAGSRRYNVKLPESLYIKRIEVGTGHSPFTRLMGTTLDSVVESVYLNYEPSRQFGGPFIHQREQPIQLCVGFDMDDGLARTSSELKAKD